MRDSVLVILEVPLISGPDVLADIFELHEKQRQAVNKPHDVRPAAVEGAAHPKLTDAEEVIVLCIVEIEHSKPLPNPIALFVAEGDLHSALNDLVFLAVRGQQRLGRHYRLYL